MILLGGTVSSNLWHHKKLSTSIIAEISWEQFTLQNESISWTKVSAIAWSQTLDRKTNWARTWQYLDILSRCAGIRKIIPLDCSFQSGQQVNWNICSDIIQMKLSICSWRTFVELLWRETVFKKCVAKNAFEWEYRGKLSGSSVNIWALCRAKVWLWRKLPFVAYCQDFLSKYLMYT